MTTTPTRKRPLDEATRRLMAVLCDADPRSVDKVLAGQPVRGLTGQRIRATLEAAGIEVPTPAGGER